MSNSVGEDLILEIFKRLPFKSVVRFISLSKSLCSIISSPNFIRKHTSRSPKRQRLLIRHQSSNKDQFCTLHSEQEQLPFSQGCVTAIEFPCKYFDIVGLCDGVLCLVVDQKHITLWNPSIRHKLTLPDCPRRSSSKVVTVTGFGFDPITDNYKIVSISYPYSYVYAMKTGTWCAITSNPTPLFSCVLSNACFLNGSLHWVVQRYYTKSDCEKFCCVMTFNLSTNGFSMIRLPEAKWETIGLTTIQGSIAVVSTKSGNSCMWVRRDGSWSVVFELNKNDVWRGIKRVMQPSANDDVLFNTSDKGFQVYDPKIRACLQLWTPMPLVA